MRGGTNAGQSPACAPGPARDHRSSMVLPPAWRTRTTPGRRLFASVVTVVPLLAIGLLIMLGIVAILSALQLPGWVAVLPWLIPTAIATFWASRARSGADPCADDMTWILWAIQRVAVGEGEPSPLPVRVLVALVIGAPLLWVTLVLFVLGMS